MTSILPQNMNTALLSQTKGVPDLDMKRIDETAKEFEAMFISEMMKPMFDTVKVDSVFGGGKGEEVFRGFMRDEYGKIITETGTVGIAQQVKEQLIEMQSRPRMAQDMQDPYGKGAAHA